MKHGLAMQGRVWYGPHTFSLFTLHNHTTAWAKPYAANGCESKPRRLSQACATCGEPLTLHRLTLVHLSSRVYSSRLPTELAHWSLGGVLRVTLLRQRKVGLIV